MDRPPRLRPGGSDLSPTSARGLACRRQKTGRRQREYSILDAKIIWLIALGLLYWAYGVTIDPKCTANLGGDENQPKRNDRFWMWAFIVAAMATSGGWTFVERPLSLRLYESYFCAIAMPFAGVLLLRRWRAMSIGFRNIKPHKENIDRYQEENLKTFSIAMALVFSTPYLYQTLGLGSFFFRIDFRAPFLNWLANWFLFAAMMVCIASGLLRTPAFVKMVGIVGNAVVGSWLVLRAVASMKTVQRALMLAGIIMAAIIASYVVSLTEAPRPQLVEAASDPFGDDLYRMARDRMGSPPFIIFRPEDLQWRHANPPPPRDWPRRDDLSRALVLLAYMIALIAIQSARPRR